MRAPSPLLTTARWATATLVLAVARPAYGHAFGQRYDLPVPLAFYLTGAAAAVAVSFLVVGVFLRGAGWSRDYPRLDLSRTALGRALTAGAVRIGVRLVAAALFLVVLAAALFGNPHPLRNIAPVMVWIIGWVGLAYVSAFVGDVWVLLNPWRTLFAAAEWLYGKATGGRALSLGRPYPAAAGVWPGVALLLLFVWLELVFPDPALPANIGWMLLGYSAVTWAAMFVFGRERWLRHGEVFALLFGLLARFAPTEARVSDPAVCAACGLGCRDADGACINCATCFARAAPEARAWGLRPIAVGLLRDEPVPASVVGFVLLVLASVLYDGLLVTPAWGAVEAALQAFLAGEDEAARLAFRTIGLVAFWLVFLGAYLGTCHLAAWAAGGRLGGGEIARRFVYALVPIAIAYHLAHYLSYLLVQGQYVIPLLSDPFGRGWDLFGTVGYRVDIGVVDARFAWYTAVVSIVLGHIIAVYLAHVRAVTVIGPRRAAIRSQYPMTVLMVAYTVTSLSILAEPIVQRAPAAAPATVARVAVPADAVLPEPATGRLVPVSPGKSARTGLLFGSLASVFHDGTGMTVADVLYPYVVAYRWGVKDPEGKTPYDPAIDRATALVRARLTGLRFVGVDTSSRSLRFGDLSFVRKMLLIEVYVNAPGDGTATALAPPWSSVPWHVIALMEAAVERHWAAFSREAAAKAGVPWLDIVRDSRLKVRLAALVERFAREGFVPEALRGRVSAEEATARWKALKAFYSKHGHFLVTNGPYRLKEWSDKATVLQVLRDIRYPLGIGSFDGYAIPRRAYITKVEEVGGNLRLAVEIERLEKFMRSYRIERIPLGKAKGGILKRQTIACRYVVVGADGKVALTGDGRFDDGGTCTLDLAAKLPPGRYTVLAAVYLGGNTMNPEIRRIEYAVPAPTG